MSAADISWLGARLASWLARRVLRRGSPAGELPASASGATNLTLLDPRSAIQVDELRRLDAAYAGELYRHFSGEPVFAAAVDQEGSFFGIGGRLRDAYLAPRGLCLLGLEKGRCVACVGVRARVDDPQEAEVRRLYVAPHCRGRGLARRLLRRAVIEASALGFRRLLLSSPDRMSSVHRLYVAQGFVQVSPSRLLPREVAPRFSTYALLLG